MTVLSNTGTYTLYLVLRDPKGKIIEEHNMMTDKLSSVVNRLRVVADKLGAKKK